jgi:hypothetical protein
MVVHLHCSHLLLDEKFEAWVKARMLISARITIVSAHGGASSQFPFTSK